MIVADVEDDDVGALLVGGGLRPRPGPCATRPGSVSVKRGTPVVIDRQCRGRAARSRAPRPAGTRPSIGRPAREAGPEVGRRDVEAGDRARARPATRRRAGGRRGRRPARRPRRSRGRGSRRAGARSPCWRPRRRRARGTARGRAPASASSVSAVTDAPLALDLDRARLDARRCPSTAASASARRSCGAGHDPAPLLPRVAGDDEEHPVEARGAWRHLGRHDHVRRRARDRRCPRAPRSAPPFGHRRA